MSDSSFTAQPPVRNGLSLNIKIVGALSLAMIVVLAVSVTGNLWIVQLIDSKHHDINTAYEKQVVALTEVRDQLNGGFAVQEGILDSIANRFQVDPTTDLLTALRAAEPAGEIVHEGDGYRERWSGGRNRRVRRSLSRMLPHTGETEHDGGAAVFAAVPIAEGDQAPARVTEFIFTTMDTDAIETLVVETQNAAKDPTRLASKIIQELGAIADERLPAQDVKNFYGGKIDELNQLSDERETVGAELEAFKVQARIAVAVLGLGTLLVAVTAVWMLSAQMATNPVRRQSHAITALIDGDLDVEIVGASRTDEVGELARGLVRFRHALAEIEKLQRKAELEHERQKSEVKSAIQNMADRIDTETRTAVEGVSAQTGVMSERVQALFASSDRMKDNAQGVADAAGIAERNSTEVSIATTGLISAIQDITERMRDSAETARRSASIAESTKTAAGELATVVENVGQVVGLISTIARETNLLALNATIESARAGEAGRGFAVVANAVKNLADQTQSSTEQITGQVQEVRTVASRVVEQIQQVVDVSVQIDHQLASAATALETQQRVSTEIGARTETASKSARSVSTRIAQVAEEANQVQQTSQNVDTLSGDVRLNIGELSTVLTRVVRLSTVEADRRTDDRTTINQPVVVTVKSDGQVYRPALHDISKGGCRLADVLDIELQTEIEMHLQDFQTPISARIVHKSNNHTHLQFGMDDEQRDALGSYVARFAG